MKKILGILVLVLFITSQSQAKVKSKDINFLGNFYTTEIKSCKALLAEDIFLPIYSSKGKILTSSPYRITTF